LTPAGASYWHRGIRPEIVVPLAEEVTPLSPEAAHRLTAEQLRASGDRQLLQALESVGHPAKWTPRVSVPRKGV
jgi:C-terminal processing protease CtpA/Prc